MKRLIAAVLVVMLSTVATMAAVTAGVEPKVLTSFTGNIIIMAVNIDMSQDSRLVGSYGAKLLWDPTKLQYVGDFPGATFKGAAVNRLNVAAGSLRFAASDPYGKTGLVNIMNVTFRIIGASPGTTQTNLSFTSMACDYTCGFKSLLPVTVQNATVTLVAP